MANVGSHLHLQIKLSNRFTYRPFIRAVTAAIAMAISGRTRLSAAKNGGSEEGHQKFWDYRPFTRIVQSLRAFLNLKDYVRINELEGFGYRHEDARFKLKIERRFYEERW